MRSIRISLVCITFILLMLGVIMTYASSAIYAGVTFGDSMFFLKRHLVSLAVGFAVSFFILTLNADVIRAHSKHILVFSIFLLLLVLIPGIGRSAGGARRWLGLLIFNIQPSEIAKIALVIYLADFVERRETRIRNFVHGYLPPLIVLTGVMCLIVLEPDLGTTITVGVIGFLVLFISGAQCRHIMLTGLAAVPFMYYLVFRIPYRKKRMLAYLNPWLDERGAGFQIVQSFLALGSGGLLGVGLGQSKQKLFFLPASHTDFIFSIIGEELGFIGALCVILLFLAMIWTGVRAAVRVNELFRQTLILGLVFMIAFEAMLNIGVASGFLPTKGLPLPFISYGGTSLVMHMAAIALILNATRECSRSRIVSGI